MKYPKPHAPHQADKIRLSDVSLKTLSETGSMRLAVPFPRFYLDENKFNEADALDYFTSHVQINFNYKADKQKPTSCEQAEIRQNPYLFYTFGKPAKNAPLFYACFLAWEIESWSDYTREDGQMYYKDTHIKLAKLHRHIARGVIKGAEKLSITSAALLEFRALYANKFEKTGQPRIDVATRALTLGMKLLWKE